MKLLEALNPNVPLRTAFLHALTRGDNATFDPVRIGAASALLTLCGLQVYVAVQDPASFNPVNFGSAVAAILAAVVAQDRINAALPREDISAAAKDCPVKEV